jgi:hypothetical protein
MGMMFPGFGIFFGIILISIVLIGIFFSIKFLRGRTSYNTPGLREEDLNTQDPGNNAIQRRILQLAQDNRGVLTVTDVVLATDLSTKRAEQMLNDMADGYRVKMNVKDSGIVFYEFIELVNSDKHRV